MADANALPSSYESLYQQALHMAERGQMEAALALLKRIAARLSTLSPATLERRRDLAALGTLSTTRAARIQAGLGLYDEAVATLQSGLLFHPEHADAFDRDIAMVRAEQGQLTVACDLLTALTDRNPDDWQSWMGLAQFHAKLTDAGAAESSLARAGSSAPSDEAKFAVAVTRFRIAAWAGNTQEAIAAWDAAADVHAGVAMVQGELYEFLLAQGETTRMRRYVDADPVPARAGLMRGILAQRSGDYAEARVQWERVKALSPAEMRAGHMDWAEAALRLGEPQSAAALIAANPPDLRSSRGVLLAAILAARGHRLTSARELLTAGAALLQDHFPWENRYSFADWDLFTTHVDDREAQRTLSVFFRTSVDAA